MKTVSVLVIVYSIILCSISVECYAALGVVSVNGEGITFPDNSVQKKAVILPTCSTGEVYVNSADSLQCGKLLPVLNGIAICVQGNCALSACLQGYENCDVLKLGCETDISTSISNCGGCGNVCPVGGTCEKGICKVNSDVAP